MVLCHGYDDGDDSSQSRIKDLRDVADFWFVRRSVLRRVSNARVIQEASRIGYVTTHGYDDGDDSSQSRIKDLRDVADFWFVRRSVLRRVSNARVIQEASRMGYVTTHQQS